MTCVYSTNLNLQGGHYGNAVLTRFPVKAADNRHYQMKTPREPRGIQQLVLDVHGREVAILNTHLDVGDDDSERWSSVQEILRLEQANGARPLILCGDFNATPDSRVIKELGTTLTDPRTVAGSGGGYTVPVEAPRERIDYIWMSKTGGLTAKHGWNPFTRPPITCR